MAIQASVGVSLEKDPRLAAKEAIRQARQNLSSESPSMAFIFSTVSLASTGLLKTAAISLGGIPLIGATGAAIISNQGVFKHGVAVMLVSLPKTVDFNTACVSRIQEKTALAAGTELAEKLLLNFTQSRRHLSTVFSDGLLKDGSGLLLGLQEKLGTSFPLVGASASDNLRFLRAYVYFNEEMLSDAACAVLWAGKLNFGFGSRHGWKPLGKPRYATKSVGNVLHQIDDEPAAKIYEEYFACNLEELRKKLKYISVLYPIGAYLEGEKEYLLRNIVSIADDGSLFLQGSVPAGSMVRLMIGTKESCLEAARQAAEEAKTERADFVLVFNSVSRYILLRKEARKELEIIQDVFGSDVPVIGLYTYGEQAPLQAISYHGKSYFHNQTLTVLAVEGTD